MEPDQPAGEPTGEPAGEPCDDPKPAAEEQHLQQQSATHTAARSYECTFCKRGFTNAQALGGHMNIHRKDKTKFKHSTATQNDVGDSPSATRPRLSATTATAAAGGNPFSISSSPAKWFSTAPQDDKKPLPLFGHRASDAPAGGSRNTRQENELRQPPSPAGEVDLELRLGHVEPSPESSPENKNTTTRKFF